MLGCQVVKSAQNTAAKSILGISAHFYDIIQIRIFVQRSVIKIPAGDTGPVLCENLGRNQELLKSMRGQKFGVNLVPKIKKCGDFSETNHLGVINAEFCAAMF